MFEVVTMRERGMREREEEKEVREKEREHACSRKRERAGWIVVEGERSL